MAKDKDLPYPPDYMHTHWIIPQRWNEGVLLPIEQAVQVMANLTRGTRVRIESLSGVENYHRLIYPSGEPIDHSITYIGPKDQVEMDLTDAEARAYIDVLAATVNLQSTGERPPLPFTYREWLRTNSER